MAAVGDLERSRARPREGRRRLSAPQDSLSGDVEPGSAPVVLRTPAHGRVRVLVPPDGYALARVAGGALRLGRRHRAGADSGELEPVFGRRPARAVAHATDRGPGDCGQGRAAGTDVPAFDATDH